MKRVVVALALMLSGCAFGQSFVDSFKQVPGQRISLPYREPVMGSSYSVSVRLMDGVFSPMCSLPDAANEYSCMFYYGWLEGGGLVGVGKDGYRFLSFDTATQACTTAMWTANGGQWEIFACSRALMMHRWMEDGERYEDEPTGE